MAIQLPNFQRISFQEANPLLTGFGAGQDIISNVLKQQMTDLANQKSQAELPYAGILAKSTADYKNAMAKYLSSPGGQGRGLSSLGKLLNEQASGLGENYQSDNNQSGDNNVYGLAVQKNTTDTDTRKRNIFATNIEKTMKYINPDDLAKYSGISGNIAKFWQQGKSAMGDASPEYTAYSKSMNAAKFLSKQVRQFYGASITPEMDQQLNALSNPESWKNDPELTKELYNQFTQILGNELGTYRQALRTPKAYEAQNLPTQNNKNSDKGTSTGKIWKWNQATGRLE